MRTLPFLFPLSSTLFVWCDSESGGGGGENGGGVRRQQLLEIDGDNLYQYKTVN